MLCYHFLKVYIERKPSKARTFCKIDPLNPLRFKPLTTETETNSVFTFQFSNDKIECFFCIIIFIIQKLKKVQFWHILWTCTFLAESLASYLQL
jgi:hypothetical protein